VSIERRCIECNELLISNWQKKFCSLKCSSTYSSKTRKPHNCSKCNKPLYAKWNEHEQKCAGVVETKYRTKLKEEKLCRGCGISFSYYPGRETVYCSKSCWLKNKQRFATEKMKDAQRNSGKLAAKRNGSGYKPGSGIGKSGRYNGIWCDSSWELAFLIYHFDHNIPIERNKVRYPYIYNNRLFNYIPDFIVNGDIVEIKGYIQEKDIAKMNGCGKHIILIDKAGIAPYLNYVKEKYGKNFIDLYEKL
jgi:hypothetical protein